MKNYYSNGKLLITGEYVVLDGALSLAIPTKYGQSLKVATINASKLIWKSVNEDENVWYEHHFDITTDRHLKFTNNQNPVTLRLSQILNAVKQINPTFLEGSGGFEITTHRDFSKNWGLGTSSTLINNIANWGEVDPYELLELTFGGSGYDIACAQYNSPILYQLQENSRYIEPIEFNPKFKDCLYFVFLNKKQNSRSAIKTYRTQTTIGLDKLLESISEITKAILTSTDLDDFNELLVAHENIISKAINEVTVKEKYFNDFDGAIKSLGGWGGDFILVSSKTNPTDYFKEKGFSTILRYDNMILSSKLKT